VQTTIPSRVITGVVLPRSTAVTVGLVIGFALLTAVAAQVVIPLPFTPVPITGQTFAVLLAGAALGANAGAASQGLYVLLGAVGLPFYAGGSSGWTVVQGATGGYLIGFIVAAWVVGALAERQQDRSVATAIPAFLLGTVIIHLCGVPWLAAALDVPWTEAAALGTVPFIVGDLIKVALAGLVLPAAWALVGAARRQ
jgi:biotin transport system substrate-specific component